jgi:hypothetical protein
VTGNLVQHVADAEFHTVTQSGEMCVALARAGGLRFYQGLDMMAQLVNGPTGHCAFNGETLVHCIDDDEHVVVETVRYPQRAMLALLSAALPRYQHTAANRFLARDRARDVVRLVYSFL